MIRPFKFFKENPYNREINWDYYRTITTRAIQLMDWRDVTINNYHFRVYTHHSQGEVVDIVTDIVETFGAHIGEDSQRILNILVARFPRVILL